jgi:hypothetical protein
MQKHSNIMIKSMLVTVLLLTLSACGGSGTATNVQTLWTSPNIANLGVVRATHAQQNGVGLVENVNSTVKYETFEVTSVQSASVNSDGSVNGTITVRWADGSQGVVSGIWYGSGDELSGIYGSVTANSVSIWASGSPATNIPAGNFTYAGQAITAYNYGDNTYDEDGTFTMNLNFSSNSGSLTAYMEESTYANSNLSVNSSGNIIGSGGKFYIYSNENKNTLLATRTDITFNGTVHNSGATHVTGLAVGGANGVDATIVAIAGKR